MEISEFIDKIKFKISEKIGREAIVRKINNRNEFFILDIAFSYFQKADRNRRNDYRSGYLYFEKNGVNQLLFIIAHSPIMIDFFSNNFNFIRFREIIIKTANFRDNHFIRFAQSSANKIKFQTNNINEFLQKLDYYESKNFKKQVFTNSNSKDSKSGNIFVIKIASGFEINDIDLIIDESWDLFLWLYPSKPIFSRTASLNRSLQKIPKQCEIEKIIGVPDVIKIKKCFGQIEGAHIKPHKLGGSDKLENGLWLCKLHHRLTEGRIEGYRDLDKVKVSYLNKHKK